MNVQEIGRKIGITPLEWEGRCYEIARRIVDRGIVEGRAVYGHWLGEIAKDSFFPSTRPLTQHGWIVLHDGQVMDPTRWVFEAVEPYIYLGPASGEYDEGGNLLRLEMERPVPVLELGDKMIELDLDWVTTTVFLSGVLGLDKKMSMKQLFWLANLALPRLSGYALEIYSAIVLSGNGAAIPIDNRRAVLRDEGE